MTELLEPTSASSRAPRRGAAAGLVLLAWCAAVAVAATAGWLVVDRVGSSLLGAADPDLGTRPISTAASTGGAGQPSILSTAGGRVTATCTAAGAITLGTAVPTQGWRVEVNARGPQSLNVEFRSGTRKAEVDGVCRNGVAVLTQGHGGGAVATSPQPAATSLTSDDHGGNRGGGGSGGGSGSGSSDGGGGSGSGSGSAKGSGGSGSSGKG